MFSSPQNNNNIERLLPSHHHHHHHHHDDAHLDGGGGVPDGGWWKSKRPSAIVLFLSGFVALLVGVSVLWSLDKSTTLSALPARYRDTRVRVPGPAVPLKTVEDGEWTFGDHINTTSKYSNVLSEGAILDDGVVGEMKRRVPVFLMEDDFVINDDIDDIDYSSKTFFSPNTLKDSEGRRILARDENVCRLAAKFEEYNPKTCLGAPYLYVTFHGGFQDRRVKTVCKYTRDGCSLGSALMPSSLHEIHSLRGILYHHNFLFVAEAWRKNSRIMKYSRCNPDLGHRRELLQVIVDQKDSDASGMIHPYGFAKKFGDPYIYVSAQGTSLVLRFHEETGEPGPDAIGLSQARSENSGIAPFEDDDADDEDLKFKPSPVPVRASVAYKGTFVDLGYDEIRGIAFDDQGLLYVANKQKGIMVYNRNGYLLGRLPLEVRKPISIHFCSARGSIWVGSAKEHVLYEFDASTWQIMQTIDHRKLNHPAGFVTHGDSLFVVSQGKNMLLEFSMMTGDLIDVVLPNLKDAGERVVLSSC